MKPLFIVVTSRGTLRAGWIEPAPLQPTRGATPRPPRIRWVRELALVHPRQHMVEQVTDLSGAYAATNSSGMAAPPGRMPSSISETHWKEEEERKVIAELVQSITTVCAQEKPALWSLSAPADLHHTLLSALPGALRESICLLVPKDLARADPENLLAHFLPQAKDALLKP